MRLLKGSFVIRVSLILSRSENVSPEDIKQVIFLIFFLIAPLPSIFIPCGGRKPSGGARSTAPTAHVMPSAQLSMVALTTASLYDFEILSLFFSDVVSLNKICPNQRWLCCPCKTYLVCET